jgi:hypothetical protein
MAKKVRKRVRAVAEEQGTKPVRLDLSLSHHARLERLARRLGLSKSSYVRMALFERMERDEGKGGGS